MPAAALPRHRLLVGPGRTAELAVAAALLSAGAAAIHAAVAGPHLDEYAPFGALFVASALAQALWAALVLSMPSKRLLAAGIAGNGAIIIVWTLSRTSGLPLGPDPWTAEPVAAVDVAATAFELGILAASALLLAPRRAIARAAGHRVTRVAAIGAMAVAGLTGAAIAATPEGGAGHHQSGVSDHPEPGHRVNSTAHSPSGVHARASHTAPPRLQRKAGTTAGSRQRAHPEAHAVPHGHAKPRGLG